MSPSSPRALAAPCLVARVLVLAAAALTSSAGPAHAQTFTKMTGVVPAILAGGHRATNWVDMDDDGDLDLYVTRGGTLFENNVLYRNDGGGTFVQDTSNAIANDSIRADGSTWGDYDGDGDNDLFVVSWYGENNALFENLGSGNFQRVTTGPAVTTGTFSEDCAWVDYDNDGDLDLFVANSNNEKNMLYRNDGGGTLTPLLGTPIAALNRNSRHGAWADYDGDGDQDLLVVNESNQPNELYQNQLDTGLAFFVSVDAGDLTTVLKQSFSASWGDFDNDGDLDVVIAESNAQKNSFYRNELVESGTATFTNLIDIGPAAHRGWSISTHWGDFDNDADLDLILTNGFSNTPGQIRRNFLYRNDGGDLVKILTGVIPEDTLWTYGASWGDYDGDGDLDLHTANWINNDQTCGLYRNEAQANGNHWLTVKCVGTVSNTTGIGATIRAKAMVDGSPVWQMRIVSGSDGQSSQNLWQHFGLADASTVDSLVVEWPSGTVQVLESVAVDQVLTVVEPDSGAVGVNESPRTPPGFLREARPNPFRSKTAVRFELPARGDVSLNIHDVSGRLVRALDAGSRDAGLHEVTWDGRATAGGPVAAGVYFARLAVTSRDGPVPATTVESVRLLRIR